MKPTEQTQSSLVTTKLQEILNNGNNSDRDNFFKIINNNIDWNEILKVINENLAENIRVKYKQSDISILSKCLILGKFLNLSDYLLPFQIAEVKIYKEFTGINSFEEIPKVKIFGTFRKDLEDNNIWDKLFTKFYEQLESPGINILEYKLADKENNLHSSYLEEKYSKNENIISEIEKRINALYERKLPLNLIGINDEKAKDLNETLSDVKIQIEKLMNENSGSEFPEYNKLINIEKIIENIRKSASGSEKENKEKEKDEETTQKNDKLKEPGKKIIKETDDLHKKIVESFYKNLDQYTSKPENKNDNIDSKETESDDIISDKLKYADEIIDELKKSLNILIDFSAYRSNKIQVKTTGDKTHEIEKVEVTDVIKLKSHEAIELRPKIKKEGIFNDENLTEDYELGFRFHQLGLKTGFFNIKLDSNNESTRISTAEFFPNTFWASVKQRSRWIAGICLQNWKAHKWKGNLTTKYFLFRDRKPLFSLPGAFLSNIVFFYFVYTVICDIFQLNSPFPLVNHASPLWYLMVSILVFMISRTTHRFIFTYNWYGFRFAASSLARSVLDTVVNFFAIMRALKVFRQTKKKVVWDSTNHY